MPSSSEKPTRPAPSLVSRLVRSIFWLLGIAAALAVAGAFAVSLGLALAYPNLPDISALADYRPKLPMRVYSS